MSKQDDALNAYLRYAVETHRLGVLAREATDAQTMKRYFALQDPRLEPQQRLWEAYLDAGGTREEGAAALAREVGDGR